MRVMEREAVECFVSDAKPDPFGRCTCMHEWGQHVVGSGFCRWHFLLIAPTSLEKVEINCGTDIRAEMRDLIRRLRNCENLRPALLSSFSKLYAQFCCICSI
jgi:hypothetical protein